MLSKAFEEPVERVQPDKPAQGLSSLQVKTPGQPLTAALFIEIMSADLKESNEGVTGQKARSVNLPINFQRDSGYLTEQAMDMLDMVICPALLDDRMKNARFQVIGHTDDIGELDVNMYISRLRAQAVKTYLVTRCNIEPESLELVFLGPSQPLVPNTSEENRKKNRRVELRRTY